MKVSKERKVNTSQKENDQKDMQRNLLTYHERTRSF